MQVYCISFVSLFNSSLSVCVPRQYPQPVVKVKPLTLMVTLGNLVHPLWPLKPNRLQESKHCLLLFFSQWSPKAQASNKIIFIDLDGCLDGRIKEREDKPNGEQ